MNAYRLPSIDLLLIDTLMRLDLGFYALERAEASLETFPDSPEVRRALAMVLDAFGHSEEALHVLSQGAAEGAGELWVRLLERTGRADEAIRVRQRTGMLGGGRTEPALSLAPAEMAVAWVADTPATAGVSRLLVQRLSEETARDASPFVRGLHQLTLAWYQTDGADDASRAERWEAAGRDAMERATALHKLAMLLGRAGRNDEALEAVERALRWMPGSRVLWRMRICLSGGRREWVRQARALLPSDPEIWLAYLVAEVRAEGKGFDAGKAVAEAASQELFPAGTMARAGDFLLRAGHLKAAEAASRYAVQRADGLLPAYALGVRCASAADDRDWALKCAARGAEIAADPAPFLRVIVRIRMQRTQEDASLVRHLEVLRGAYPDDVEWSERLGVIYFGRGDMEEALRAFRVVREKPERASCVGVLLRLAEALRQQGRRGEAIRILQSARDRFPDSVHALNNLVYVLSETTGTLARAGDLVTNLLTVASSSSAYDTAGAVYYRLGDFGQAETCMRKALGMLDPADSHWYEIHLNAAEMQLDMGEYRRARDTLGRMRGDGRAASAIDERREADILARIEKAER